MENRKLTGEDYMTRPYLELLSHPDFSPDALRIITTIKLMTTKELENIKLFGGNNG